MRMPTDAAAESDRSNQKLIMSDEEAAVTAAAAADRDRTARRLRRRAKLEATIAVETPSHPPNATEIVETNVDLPEGRINPAFEDDTMKAESSREGEEASKPKKKRIRRAKKMTETMGWFT